MNDEDLKTSWDETRMLTAIADVEDRTLRGQRMLSQRIERLEKNRGSHDFGDITETVASLATSLLIAYGIVVVVRTVLACVQQQQQL